MARVTLRLPTPLRPYADGRPEVAVDADTVREALDALAADYGPLIQQIRTRDGALRPYVNVFVRQTDIRSQDGLETHLDDGDEIIIMPSVAGG